MSKRTMIRLDLDLILDVKMLLSDLGLAPITTTNAGVVKTALLYLLQTESRRLINLPDPEAITSHPNPNLAARVQRWASETDFGMVTQKESRLPAEIEEELLKADKEMAAPKIDIEEYLSKEPDRSGQRKPSISDIPPWEQLSRMDIEDVRAAKRNHPLLSWAEDDFLKQKAVECTFALLPKTMYKTLKMGEMARDLYDKFKKWADETGFLPKEEKDDSV